MDGKQLATIKETFEYFLDKYFKPQIQKKVSQNALGIFKNVAGLSKTLYAESEFKFPGLKKYVLIFKPKFTLFSGFK